MVLPPKAIADGTTIFEGKAIPNASVIGVGSHTGIHKDEIPASIHGEIPPIGKEAAPDVINGDNAITSPKNATFGEEEVIPIGAKADGEGPSGIVKMVNVLAEHIGLCKDKAPIPLPKAMTNDLKGRVKIHGPVEHIIGEPIHNDHINFNVATVGVGHANHARAIESLDHGILHGVTPRGTPGAPPF